VSRARTVLVGRDREIAWLTRSLDEMEAGHGWVAVVEGEAGIGKTRLLDEAIQAAGARGHAVLVATGYELGHEHSYGAIADALDLRTSAPDTLRASIAELLRDPCENRHLEFRLLQDMLTLVERLSMDLPVVLTMDDLQWVDSASLLALAHIARHVTPLRAAVLLAVRPPPRRPQTDQFLRSVGAIARWMPLAPLSNVEVGVLTGGLLGRQPDARLLSQLERAGGNPLFVSELAEAFRLAGSLAPEHDTVAVGSGKSLPTSICRLVERRLSTMPEATATMLRTASLLGCDFALQDLVDVLGQPAARVADMIEPALQDGLLGGSGRRIAFRHQLVRDAIYERMPLAMRTALHRDIGRSLARRGSDPGQVATHLALGGDDVVPEAVEWMRRAAGDASSTSPALAVEYLDRAIELAGRAERSEEALQASDDVLRTTGDTGMEDRLRLDLANALMVQGRWELSAKQLEILASREGASELERARLLGDAALARAHCGDLERAVAHAEESRATGERLRDHVAQSVALSSLAVVAHFQARHVDSVKASRESLALAARGNSRDVALRPAALWLGLGLVDIDEFDEALTVLTVGRRRSEENGMAWQLPLFDDGIGTLRFYAGDWDDAVAEMETCIALAHRAGTLCWLVPANCTLACIAIHRGQDPLAGAAISTALRQSALSGGIGGNRLRWVSGLHREASCDLPGALALVEESWSTTIEEGFLPHLITIGPDLVRIALGAGKTGRAREVAEVVERMAAGTGVASAVATGQRCRGMVEADAPLLMQAVATLHQSPRRVELAFACEEAGNLWARVGDAEGAVALLDEALAVYRGLGARHDTDRVHAALHALGVRRARGRRCPRPALGWAALTETEARVAALASGGLTNPEIGARLFVSPRTVGTHLAHIFAKLEISSRVELARLAGLRGGASAPAARSVI
jgi:DNA-binding CsgD family transcriptional regulator